jgi:hypothetical protein
MKKKKLMCKVRPDLIDKKIGIPVGDTFIGKGEYEYRWMQDQFQINVNGYWLDAYSTDFIFS